MASQILRRAMAISLTLALLAGPQAASGASLKSSYYPNWDGNGCRNIVPSQIEWQCQAGAAMTTTTNQQYVYESVTLSVSTIGSYAPWSGSLQIIDVADSSQDCIVSIPAAAGTWECDISGAIGSELDIQLATSSSGVEIVQLAFAPLNQPTATPTDTATATGQPTDTPTATVVPGSTSTPIPTNTPRPVKTSIATVTNTPTPVAPLYRDCGDATFPLLNCSWVGGSFASSPVSWNNQYPGSSECAPNDPSNSPLYPFVYNNVGGFGPACDSTVEAHASGNLYMEYQYTPIQGSLGAGAVTHGGSATFVSLNGTGCQAGTANHCIVALVSVTTGDLYDFVVFAENGGNGYGDGSLYIDKVWVQSSANPTPATPLPTVPAATITDTPLPLPFDTGTPLATGTPCPGGCAVGEATSLPGAIDTVLPIDTSPLSPLEHLSVSRTACQTFGSAPILVPSIHGTPVFGSTEPLSITWSLPVTGTTFTPCADPAFSTTWWDLMWHLSVIVTFVAFLSWLIWYVRRLFT